MIGREKTGKRIGEQHGEPEGNGDERPRERESVAGEGDDEKDKPDMWARA